MKEKKYRSLGINALLSTFMSALSVLFPLITYPYVFRVLHAGGVGRVDYATSIVNYFALIASLGVNVYAVREGAKVRDEKEKLNRFASQIFTINVLSTLVSFAALLLFLLVVPSMQEYKWLILLLSLSTLFSTMGIEWMNTIFEDYLYITIRSLLTRIISLVLLFVLVRNAEDYYLYALLNVFTNGIVCIMNWAYCRRYVTIKVTKKIEWKKHSKPIFLLFANSVTTSIYVSADTTMIGVFSGDVAVGLYSIAAKVYGVVKKMIVAMYSVTIPRISYHLGNNEHDKVREVYSKLLSNILIVLLPSSCGLICIAKEIILLMGGEEYLGAVSTLRLLSVALLGAILGGTVTYCYNIPFGREKDNVIATCISAAINLGLNFILIPKYKQDGAALTTAISEIFVFVFCISKNKEIIRYLDMKMIFSHLFQSLLGCVTIIVISVTMNGLLFFSPFNITIIRTVLIIFVSCVIYSIELVLLKNEFAISIIRKIKRH